MRLLHEIAIFQTVKSKVIISLFETVRLSVSISLRNLYNSLNSIKENAVITRHGMGHAEAYITLLTVLHSEQAKLVRVLAVLNAIGLKLKI